MTEQHQPPVLVSLIVQAPNTGTLTTINHLLVGFRYITV